MQGKSTARIVVASRQGADQTVQEIKGEVIVRGSSVYIRYEEPEKGPTGGITRTMVKITGNEIKIMRHGEIESEQTFQAGRKLPGFYHSPFTKFHLSTDTGKLDIALDGTFGRIVWEYDLYVYDELSGHFAISMLIEEEV
ncbi:putative beta-barrel protein YwiB [compost metagenome]